MVAAISHEGEPARTRTMVHDDQFEIVIEWEPRPGRPEPVSVKVTAADRRPLSAGAIRRLPLGEAIAEGRGQLDELADWMLERDDAREHAAGYVSLGAQRGQALTADDLEAVAAAYRAAWIEGRPVTEAVIDACGGGLSRSGAAKRIMKARAAGLLVGIGDRS